MSLTELKIFERIRPGKKKKTVEKLDGPVGQASLIPLRTLEEIQSFTAEIATADLPQALYIAQVLQYEAQKLVEQNAHSNNEYLPIIHSGLKLLGQRLTAENQSETVQLKETITDALSLIFLLSH